MLIGCTRLDKEILLISLLGCVQINIQRLLTQIYTTQTSIYILTHNTHYKQYTHTLHTYMYVYVYLHTTHTHTHSHSHPHTHTWTHIRAHMHTHTYTHSHPTHPTHLFTQESRGSRRCTGILLRCQSTTQSTSCGLQKHFLPVPRLQHISSQHTHTI